MEWDVTVVDVHVPSRLNQGFLCNPATTTTDAESRELENIIGLIHNGFILQPVEHQVQRFPGGSNEIFITLRGKALCCSEDDQRAGSFSEQLISMALRVSNAACVSGPEMLLSKLIIFNTILWEAFCNSTISVDSDGLLG